MKAQRSRIFRSASSRTEMTAEDQARGSGAVPEDDFPAEDPFEQALSDGIEVSMREDEDWWRSSRGW